MKMRRFCIYKRRDQAVYYTQIKNPETGKYLPARSTGVSDKSEAYLVVSDWIQNGIPENKHTDKRTPLQEIFTLDTIVNVLDDMDLSSQDALRITSILQKKGVIGNVATKKKAKQDTFLFPFLEKFWDYETSQYVKEKHAYGQTIGKRHCYEQIRKLNHWKEFFPTSTLLTDVTQQDLRKFQLKLKDKNLAAKTINFILCTGTVAFNWAAARGEITLNPATGLRKFSGQSKKRDILTPEEIEKIFSVKWKDERARVGNLLSMTTGMRAGEVAALRAEDILEDRLVIRHSWSFADGLKKPKNGEERIVPLLPKVRKELLKLLISSPYGNEGFVFYGVNPEKPMHIDALSRELTKAYIEIKLPENKKDNKKEKVKIRRAMIDRGICFHSWRHFYAANLADKVGIRQVQLATGHKTTAMAEHYANHVQSNHLKAVSQAVSDSFDSLVEKISS
jgi:integrase